MKRLRFIVRVDTGSQIRCYLGYAHGEYYTGLYRKFAEVFTMGTFLNNKEVQDLLKNKKYKLEKIE